MASIIYQTNKKSGVKYAYSSESYWDKDKKQPRTRRTYLGKVDPETGEIIMKKDKSSSDLPAQDLTSVSPDIQKLLMDKDREILRLQDTVKKLSEELQKRERVLQELKKLIETV